MYDFDIPAFSLGESDNSDSTDSDESERWAAIIRPPEESDADPREAAERLFGAVHGLGRCSFEIHSDGANVEIHLGATDRPTAAALARESRAELGARADVMPATMPIAEDDPVAAATLSLTNDTVYPIETDRTAAGDVGSLHHVLDTLGEEAVRGVYQVVAEPVEAGWSTRRSRAWPATLATPTEPRQEAIRGAGVMAVAVVAVLLSPLPIALALVAALGLLVAATIGEGIRLPRRRTADDIASETREQATDAHGARSTAGKNAKKAADVMVEQAAAPGWNVDVRLVVAGDTQMDSLDHRDRLVTQLKRSLSSDVTGQALVADDENGRDARDTLQRVRQRALERPSPTELARRALAHGTRREFHVGPAEIASAANFPDRDGGGEAAREFATATETSKSLPDDAPAFDRPTAAADGGESPAYQLNNPSVDVDGRHSEYGEVELKVDDSGEILAGEFVREMCEASTRDGNVALGYIEDGGRVRELCITADQLPQHLFVCGASGAGKTTLAEYLSLQHAHAGRGFAVIDPHNDLVDDVKTKLPAHRADDVIAIDPQDTSSERTITINFLDVEVGPDEPGYEEAVNAAVSDIVAVLGQGASSMGDRMKPYIRAVSRGMIISEEAFTLVDMREFFVEEERRREFASRMRSEGHDHIAEVAEEIAELDSDDLSPITRLLQKWVLSPVSRQIIEHTESSFSFRDALEEDRIILVRNNLSDGDLQRLVATAFYRKIMRAAVSRPKGERSTYPVIIDEADDIASDEMNLGDDLGNARKWGVSLCLMTQLPARLSSIKEELETNCKTFVSYACPSPSQARTISSMYDCEQSAVGKLGDYRSQIQIDVGGERAGPFKTHSPAPMPRVRDAETVVQDIDEPSRERFGIERGATVVADGAGDDDEPERTPIEQFLLEAADAVDAGVIEADQHYTFVHKGTAREQLRINPTRVFEALHEADHDQDLSITLDAVRDRASDGVDTNGSPVVAYSARSPPAGRCIGIDLDRVYSVDTGELESA